MKFTFSDLNEQEANLILNALAELPFKVSQPLIQKLSKQAADQQAAHKLAEQEELAKAVFE